MYIFKFTKTKVLLSLIIALSLFSLSCGNIAAESANAGYSAGEKARDFKLNSLSNKAISLADFRGKKNIFLIYTATWCPHCVSIIPALSKIYNRYRAKDFEIIAVYINEPENRVRTFNEKYTLPYIVLLDTDGTVASEYKIRGVPTLILIDKKGLIKYRGYNIPEDMIEELAGQ